MDEVLKNIYRIERMMLKLLPKKLYEWIISSHFTHIIFKLSSFTVPHYSSAVFISIITLRGKLTERNVLSARARESL